MGKIRAQLATPSRTRPTSRVSAALSLVPGDFFDADLAALIPHIGAGHRSYLVLTVGHKWVTLFQWTTLATHKVRRGALLERKRVHRVPPLAWLCSAIVCKREQYDRLNMQYSGLATDKAVDLLGCGK